MEHGSRELARRAAAHAVALAFGATYLCASATGAGATTALLRGCVALAVAMVLAGFLCQPVVDVVLDALARDEARRAGSRAEDDA